MTVQPTSIPGALAPNIGPAPSLGSPVAPGIEAMQTWLQLASAAETLVTPLIGSAFIPASFRTQGRDQAVERANSTGAVLLGLSLGIDPLTALQQIYIVHGRPGMYAKIKVALAQAHGHDVWDEEYGPERVTVCGHRKGWPDDRVVRVTMTMDDARRAGWDKTNDNYRKTPADMLWARAAGRVVDRIASDVLHGIASIEDLQDAPEPTPVTSRVTVDDLPAAPARAITPAAPAPVVVETDPEPTPAPEVAVEQAVPVPDPEKLRRAMGDQFNKLKVSGPGVRERRALICSDIIRRPVKLAAEMTAEEVQLVLDNLTADTVRQIEERHAAQAAAEAAPEPAPATQEWPPVAPVPAGDPWGPREYADDYDPNAAAQDGQL